MLHIIQTACSFLNLSLRTSRTCRKNYILLDNRSLCCLLLFSSPFLVIGARLYTAHMFINMFAEYAQMA